jgi:two-component system sensor histidine kinase DesK
MTDRPPRYTRYGWLFAAVWLFYLGGTLSALLARGNDWQRDLGLAALAAFAAAYLILLVRLRAPHPPCPARAWAGLLVLLILAGLQVPGAGHHALACIVYIAAAGMVGLPLRQAAPFAAVLVVGTELAAHLVPGWQDDGYGLAALLGALATWGIRLAVDRQQRLGAAQQELAAMAVHDERARIAADLHDILGHSLTVVAVKAELAQRLLDIDPDRARTELRDLESLARDALADVRSTALGVRGISLPGEIAAARAARAAADVDADLPGAADDVPTRYRELFAWTIREAVTNIVRHSGATHARIRLGPTAVEIVDDGPGDHPAAAGQGLRGLRRRADALGATLTAGRRDDGPGFRVRMQAPT